MYEYDYLAESHGPVFSDATARQDKEIWKRVRRFLARRPWPFGAANGAVQNKEREWNPSSCQRTRHTLRKSPDSGMGRRRYASIAFRETLEFAAFHANTLLLDRPLFLPGLPAKACNRSGDATLIEPFQLMHGQNVDKDFSHRIAGVIALLAIMALSGCGTSAAKDFGGRWKPVNRFQDRPTEIPLSPSYAYYASPMDETLKTMLTRWAKDSGRTLDYRLDFDVTLYKPVADIHTTDVHAAVSQLSSIYAAEGVFVTATNSLIEVAHGSVSSANNAAGAGTQAAIK